MVRTLLSGQLMRGSCLPDMTCPYLRVCLWVCIQKVDLEKDDEVYSPWPLSVMKLRKSPHLCTWTLVYAELTGCTQFGIFTFFWPLSRPLSKCSIWCRAYPLACCGHQSRQWVPPLPGTAINHDTFSPALYYISIQGKAQAHDHHPQHIQAYNLISVVS